MGQQNLYGVTSAMPGVPLVYESAALGALPGAAAMTAGVLARLDSIAIGDLVGVSFGHDAASGWRINLIRTVTAGIEVVTAKIKIGAETATIPIGAVLGDWILVTFTVDTGDDLVVYVNGEQALADTLAAPLVPAIDAADLRIPKGAAVNTAFYTESALTSLQVAALYDLVQTQTISPTDGLQHVYNATRTLRPTALVQTFLDSGLTPTVPLVAVPGNTALAYVRAGDFGQPVIAPLVAAALA